MVVPSSAPKNGLGLLNVRETAGAKNLFIRLDADDLADKDGVQPEFLVLEQPALQGKRELSGQRGVHLLAPLRCEGGVLEFVPVAS